MSDKRVPKPSYRVLADNNELTKDQLRKLLHKGASFDENNADVAQVRETIVQIKEAVKSYLIASKALSNYYLSNAASLSEGQEIRSERLHLAHEDAPEMIRALNQILRLVNEEAESSLAVGSSAASSVSKSKSHKSDSTAGTKSNVPSQHDDDRHDLDEHQSQYTISGISNISEERNFENLIPTSNSSNRLDPLSKHLLKLDLRKGLPDKFDGDPSKFWSWYMEINGYIVETDASPTEVIYILRSNTVKKPRNLIETYLSGGLSNPSRMVADIWKSLKKSFGSNSKVTNHLLAQLRSFPKVKYPHQTEELEKLVSICRAMQLNSNSCPDLKYIELQQGMREIWEKTPDQFINRWRKESNSIERRNNASPSLQNMLDSLSNFIDEYSNPNFQISTPKVKTLVTNVPGKVSSEENPSCVIHKSASHSLLNCRSFKNVGYNERKNILFENRLCFKCCGPHIASRCNANLSCSVCQKDHHELLHPIPNSDGNVSGNQNKKNRASNSEGKESNERSKERVNDNSKSFCTSVCKSFVPKSCSKTVPVEVRIEGSHDSITGLAIIDEQSNRSFIDEYAIKKLNISPECLNPNNYTLTTLSQTSSFDCVIVEGLEVKGIKKSKWLKLPPTLSHPALPDAKSETSSPDIVKAHKHIARFSKNFPRIDPNLEVIMLIGNNCGEAMKTRCYGDTFPFVHDTPLGWALVGPCCLNESSSSSPKALSTSVSSDCQHYLVSPNHNIPRIPHLPESNEIFVEKCDDEFPGTSSEDRDFMRIVSAGVRTDEDNSIEIPVPVKSDAIIPDNMAAVCIRSKNTLNRIKRDPEKASKCTEIMQKYLDHGHVEEVHPSMKAPASVYYIPVFPVYNSKTGKMRLVFDSSAKYRGTSLNDCLLQGPDAANRLIGVLLRFRRKAVGFTADIECMFHSFRVPEEQSDMLRFFWWKNNNFDEELTVYRARVHVFGNRSSPAIATFGLRYTTHNSENDCLAKKLIHENFYVDDLLGSEDNPEEAITALDSTISLLSRYNIRLHKIAATDSEVSQAFPESERVQKVESVNIEHSESHSALGISWNIPEDRLQLNVSVPEKAFTKRGVLSVNGSLYDPLGLASPVALKGRLLQRKIFENQKSEDSSTSDLDLPLPPDLKNQWSEYLDVLRRTNSISIPRCYHARGFQATVFEIHVFADASCEAIGYIIFLRELDNIGNISVSFVFANSKVSPRSATSIPRLELCAATDACKSATYIISELKMPISKIVYYSDSLVVLGYLRNKEKRFSRYVTARVETIQRLSNVDQWTYVSSTENPADIASRAHDPSQLLETNWFEGPKFLRTSDADPSPVQIPSPDVLPEEMLSAKVLQTKKRVINPIISQLVTRTYSWKKILGTVTVLFLFMHKLRKKSISYEEANQQAMKFIIKEVQSEAFPEVFKSASSGDTLPKDDKLASLAPFVDRDNIIRVGGRLQNSNLPYAEKHPILLPHDHAITSAIIRHFHDLKQHQGRHITAGGIREAGLHVLKQSKAVRSIINSCVMCKRFRGRLQVQQMAELPEGRLECTPPFTYTGLDVFGPYHIYHGPATRKTSTSRKTWVLLCTCMYSRAVHLETLSSLDTATLRLALRRFIALRGNVRHLISDHGSNFKGASNQMEKAIDLDSLKKEITSENIVWDFIPPAASHAAGVWERKIGSIKNVFNAAIKQLGTRLLTRDEFETLLQEAGAIVNQTPLAEISSDPNDPLPVTPYALLTLRDEPVSSPLDSTNKDLLSYGKARWRRVQYLADQFWSRWKADYISTLQTRTKWKKKTKNLKENDIVLIKQTSHRNAWPMGRVIKCNVSKDGLIRSVVLALRPLHDGVPRTFERSIHDLVLLVAA